VLEYDAQFQNIFQHVASSLSILDIATEELLNIDEDLQTIAEMSIADIVCEQSASAKNIEENDDDDNVDDTLTVPSIQ
jgi:hypothetical protein